VAHDKQGSRRQEEPKTAISEAGLPRQIELLVFEPKWCWMPTPSTAKHGWDVFPPSW